MNEAILVVALTAEGVFQVFRSEGGAPVEVTDEYQVDVHEDGYTLRRAPVEVVDGQ